MKRTNKQINLHKTFPMKIVPRLVFYILGLMPSGGLLMTKANEILGIKV